MLRMGSTKSSPIDNIGLLLMGLMLDSVISFSAKERWSSNVARGRHVRASALCPDTIKVRMQSQGQGRRNSFPGGLGINSAR
jgi:hypothetical protein